MLQPIKSLLKVLSERLTLFQDLERISTKRKYCALKKKNLKPSVAKEKQVQNEHKSSFQMANCRLLLRLSFRSLKTKNIVSTGFEIDL